MPKLFETWTSLQPELGSVMDTLRIETIGHIPAKTESVRSQFPFDGVGLVLRGRGFYRVADGPVRPLRAPVAFRVWPGVVFHYGPEEGTAWEERYLCFTGPRVADWMRWGWMPQSSPQSLAEPETLEQMHRRICRAFPPFSEIPLDQAKIEIELFIHELHRQSVAHSRCDKLEALIQRWIREPDSAGGLRAAAHSLGMSYSSFRQHFAQRTGLTPHQFLLRLRIDRASLRLARTHDPIKAIATDSGFAFIESFNRAFRKIKKMAPGEYRRRMMLLVAKSQPQYGKDVPVPTKRL